MLKIVKAMLIGNTTIGRSSSGDTQPVSVTKSLPQGHVLSPMLFALFANDLLLRIQALNAGRRHSGDLEHAGAIAYADDIILVDRTLNGLQQKLNVVRAWSDEWGMTVNLGKEKMEHMVFGSARNQNFTLKFGPHVVRRTKTYKYLGVVLDCEDTKLNMLAQCQKTLKAAHGAHNAVAQLQVDAPDMPLGTISSIWQTWVN